MNGKPEERSLECGDQVDLIDTKLAISLVIDDNAERGDTPASISSQSTEESEEPEEMDLPDVEQDCRVRLRDMNQLLAIFPEDVWIVLLDTIQDPQDLENMSNASLYFRSLLLPKKVISLFPRVWDILLRRRPKSLLNVSNSRETLPLRQVCRAWSSVVDNFYQNLPMISYLRGYRWASEDFSEISRFYTKQFERFYEHFENSHGGITATSGQQPGRSPFFARTTQIGFGGSHFSPQPTRQFLDQLLSLLSKYGHHFWNCSVSFGVLGQSWVECYWGLRRLLECMPNVKLLHLTFSTAMEDNYGEHEELHDDELEAEMRLHPLPRIENLETLETFMLPPVIFHQVLRSNPHAQKISIMRRLNRNDEFYDLNQVSLPNLRELSLDVRSEADFRMLESPLNNWPLTTIGKLSLINNNTFMEWSRVFAMFESKWADTLTHLSCVMPFARERNEQNRMLAEIGTLRLNLPHLKHLDLTISNVVSLDFVLPMKHMLEEFMITFNFGLLPVEEDHLVRLSVACERRGTLKLVTHLDNLAKSNVWGLFPKLRYFYCKWNVGGRQEPKVVALARK